ncbi:MAG: hypothetical protein OES13_10145, partial [Acidimicrobiia bacterium]|nr:hypothetical protein [Acidimicrobiia bacterium]
ALLDADLQDRPEDIVILLDAMKPELDVVAAGRHGTYTSPIRRGTGRLFRTTRWMLSSGRIPADAGMFLVARRPALRRALAAVDPGVHILSALARAGAEIESIPIDRDSRPGSGYAGFGRAAMAARALAGLTPLYAPVARHRRRRWSPPTVEVLTAIDAEGPS